MVHKSYSEDVEVSVSAHRLWSALVHDSQNFLPNTAPDRIASVEYEGDGLEVGAVRIVKFHEGVVPFTHVKEKLEQVDSGKRYVKFSVVEGGLPSAFSDVKVSLHFKDGVRPGTAIITSKVEYEAVGEVVEIPEEQKKGSTAAIKAAEAYLLQHNDYN